MKAPQQAALLRIYTEERAKNGGKPLYEALVLKARDDGLAGATVLRGPMGFGESHHIHNANILDLSGNLPLVIEIVDDEAKLRAFVGALGEMRDIGLVTLEKVDVLHYGNPMSNAFPITIFHNPGCGTSRNTVAMVKAAGYAPDVVEYLTAGWTAEQLRGLIVQAGVSARDLMREKGTPASDLGLLDPGVSDDVLIEAMVAHPILVNRPIVVTPKGVRLCRPSEIVFDLLERMPECFTKEDGEVVSRA